jgi:hypothetical protein
LVGVAGRHQGQQYVCMARHVLGSFDCRCG